MSPGVAKYACGTVCAMSAEHQAAPHAPPTAQHRASLCTLNLDRGYTGRTAAAVQNCTRGNRARAAALGADARDPVDAQLAQRVPCGCSFIPARGITRHRCMSSSDGPNLCMFAQLHSTHPPMAVCGRQAAHAVCDDIVLQVSWRRCCSKMPLRPFTRLTPGRLSCWLWCPPAPYAPPLASQRACRALCSCQSLGYRLCATSPVIMQPRHLLCHQTGRLIALWCYHFSNPAAEELQSPDRLCCCPMSCLLTTTASAAVVRVHPCSSSVSMCWQEAGRTLGRRVLAHMLDLGPKFHLSRSVGALARIVDRGVHPASSNGQD